jgi:hypothetical protein
MFHMGKYKKQNIVNIRPLFGHFWENLVKILAQICTAAYINYYLAAFELCGRRISQFGTSGNANNMICL